MKSLLKLYTVFSHDGASKSQAWLQKWEDALEGQTVMIKNAVRAGANSFQLFLIEIFLFKSNHTGKLIPLQNRRTYCTEHEKKVFFLFWHSDTLTKPMANAFALLGGSLAGCRASRAGSEKRAQLWSESDGSFIPIPSRLISIKFNK